MCLLGIVLSTTDLMGGLAVVGQLAFENFFMTLVLGEAFIWKAVVSADGGTLGTGSVVVDTIYTIYISLKVHIINP
jgi:hypothetical protein